MFRKSYGEVFDGDEGGNSAQARIGTSSNLLTSPHASNIASAGWQILDAGAAAF